MILEHAIKRILSINWDSIGTGVESEDTDRVYRFLSKAAKLYQLCNVSHSIPFLPLSELLRLPEDSYGLKVFSLGIVSDIQKWPFAEEIVHSYLVAVKLHEEGVSVFDVDLVDMYECLIEIFEHGGHLNIRHGELLVSKQYAIPGIAEWLDRYGVGLE